MITVEGLWYDGKSSSQMPAQLHITELGQVQVRRLADKQLLCESVFGELTVSSRLGASPRYLEFGAGQKFETSDNDAIDRAANTLQPSMLQGLIHRLESHLHFVLLTLIVVIAFAWGMVTYGVPTTAKAVAHMLPHKVLEIATEQTMLAFDGRLFQTSTLEDGVQQRVRDHFQPIIDQHPTLDIKVLFRDGGRIGANAFALPDGTIVFTDQMVTLATDDDELLAVFAHEIGHVRHRHGMRSVVQDSMLAFLLVMITGDISGTAEIFLALPIIMTELAYSRDFEREADDYALDYLREQQIPTNHFSNLMARLEQQMECQQAARVELLKNHREQEQEQEDEVVVVQGAAEPAENDEPDEDALEEAFEDKMTQQLEERCNVSALEKAAAGSKTSSAEKTTPIDDEDNSWSSYLSTHPSTEERLEKFSSP